jgi:phytoene dehydrogenase-like protein
MVSQHFFKGTPANFAFGYFQNFQDYKYPPGGTGRLPEALAGNIAARGGLIKNDCEVVGINPDQKILTDQNGSVYPYDALLWAADLKTLYRCFDYEKSPPKLRKVIEKQKNKYLPVKAGESVFTVFLAVDRPAEKFKEKSKGHFIYTPSREGLGELHRTQLKRIKANFKGVTKDELFRWLKEFCLYNSYEISIPALKNASLAPPGKTGLIISLLFDGELWKLAARAGWYDEFRTQTVEYILEALENSIYPGLKDIILFQKSATPLTLMELFGSDNGAITGWSLEEKPPVPRSLTGIMGSAKTTIPYVFRCGQWSYSPSGVPIAILTGRIAAREVLKKSARYKDRL